MGDIILKVGNLSIDFNNHSILKNVNFEVKRGDILAVVGPNGAGKSVLFRALLKLIPFSGTVQWTKGLKIGYIPQKLNVDREIPLSVLEFFKIKSQDLGAIKKVLAQVGLADKNHDNLHLEKHILRQRLGWLSGGQLQRVLIAWAIIDTPDVLLFDEPTSGIDIGGEETIYNLLNEIHIQREMTIILISHELNIVYKYASNVICLNKEMVCYGLPSEVLDPTALKNLYGGSVGFYKHDHEH